MPACVITQINTGATSVLISVLFKNERVSFQQMTVDDLDLSIKKGKIFHHFLIVVVVCSSNFQHLKPIIFRICFIKAKLALWACFCVCVGLGSVLERCVCK